MTDDEFQVETLRRIERAEQGERSEAFFREWAQINADHRGWTLKVAMKQLDAHIRDKNFDRKFYRPRTSVQAEAWLTNTPEAQAVRAEVAKEVEQRVDAIDG